MKTRVYKLFILIFLITQYISVFSQNNAYNQLQEAAGNTSVYIPPVNGPVAYGEESQSNQSNNTNAQMIATYQSKAYEINNDGVYYHNSGNYKKAIRYYRKALWYDPYNETALRNLQSAREANRIHNENKRGAIRDHNRQQREYAQSQNQNTKPTHTDNSDEDLRNGRRRPNTNEPINNISSKNAEMDAKKAYTDLEESKTKLTDLKASLDNTNRLLKIYSKSLANNTGELDKWAETVDKTYQNTLNVSKEYFTSMFLKYSLLTNLDPKYRDGPYKKLEELLLSADPEKSTWLTKELALQNLSAENVNTIVDWILLGYDAESLGVNIFSGSPDEIKTKLDAVLFVNSVFETANWVNYDLVKDAPMFKQMAGVKGITKPGDWFSQAKVVGEVYSDLVVQCVSWNNINELVSDNKDKTQKVNLLIIKQEQTIKQINCLEDCMNNSDGNCMNRCTGKTKLHTPPPFLE